MGPIKASVQLDTLGRDCYERQEGLYLYNDCVFVPPLMMIDDIASFSNCGPESIITNAIINAKIESKKFEFGPTKCFNLHIGNCRSSCHSLKVHNSPMIEKDHETYLGDVICTSGTNNRNIVQKRNGGIGSVSQIVSMLAQISLGHYHFEIALVLRESMLVSKLVSSAEIWYNVTKNQYRKLEAVDEMFLMRIFKAPKSVPRLALYIECGKLPIRFIIKVRRLLYYWHVLQLDRSELVHRFYVAQSLKPTKNDWVLQIAQDKKDLGINLYDEEVRKLTLFKFKESIQKKVNLFAARYFSDIQARQTKTQQLEISEIFKPASYLTSQKLTISEVQTLFLLRSRSINVKGNTSSAYEGNMWCRTCKLFPELQQHILQCSEIRKKVNFLDVCNLKYEMIHGTDEDQVKIAKVYHILMQARADILDE